MAAGWGARFRARVRSGVEALAHGYRKRNFYYRIMVPFAAFSTALVCVTTVTALSLIHI